MKKQNLDIRNKMKLELLALTEANKKGELPDSEYFEKYLVTQDMYSTMLAMPEAKLLY